MQTYTLELAGARLTLELPDAIPPTALHVTIGAHLAKSSGGEHDDLELFGRVLDELDVAALSHPEWSHSAPELLEATARSDDGIDAALHLYAPRTPDDPKPQPEPELAALRVLRERQEALAAAAG